MQWKLGMAVSSDTCRSLNSPYVSLLLKIVEPSGQICQRSFEMTIPQFQVYICWCECVVVGVIYYWFDSEILFLSSAELSQAVQGDGSCYGDCMMVASLRACCSYTPVYMQPTAWHRSLSAGCLKMWIRITANVSCQLCTSIFPHIAYWSSVSKI